jgi:hypothetical protein
LQKALNEAKNFFGVSGRCDRIVSRPCPHDHERSPQITAGSYQPDRHMDPNN